MVGVAQQDLRPVSLGEGVEDEPSVHAGGFLRHVRDLLSDQRSGDLSQRHVERGVLTYLLAALPDHARDPNRYRDLDRGCGRAADQALLTELPDMPTPVIMECVGWTRGKTMFGDRVQQQAVVPPS
ncbi:hypothetical protein [Micromonospora chersina]|uniref:hypothetical protein n=1 Tax=Micromonospora chersina TaxID=47854 RepID=UPI00371887B3